MVSVVNCVGIIGLWVKFHVWVWFGGGGMWCGCGLGGFFLAKNIHN